MSASAAHLGHQAEALDVRSLTIVLNLLRSSLGLGSELLLLLLLTKYDIILPTAFLIREILSEFDNSVIFFCRDLHVNGVLLRVSETNQRNGKH